MIRKLATSVLASTLFSALPFAACGAEPPSANPTTLPTGYYKNYDEYLAWHRFVYGKEPPPYPATFIYENHTYDIGYWKKDRIVREEAVVASYVSPVARTEIILSPQPLYYRPDGRTAAEPTVIIQYGRDTFPPTAPPKVIHTPPK